ncbi:hypothetical protein LOZ80_01500 [Paenibacillus sp. HWE-109]|uniref:hypothetical protein n=1 Tax=Paenibacillus sp. HWE-109 TaxID=1306526 RepID=UPI001EDE13D4|nr:hypothetical protein [Paenibacillus sp. HWE-109]UKS27653.1 hypothetical protein LOZ80_01500 [Paenibacillus sp. HWE-109]
MNKENQILLSTLETNQHPVLTNRVLSEDQGFFHETLKADSADRLHEGSNEFQFIQHMISNTVNEKEQVKVRLKQQNYLLRSNFMNRLLKGRLDNQIPIEDALPAFEMHFDSEHYAVLLFYVEANELFFSSIDGKSENEKSRLLQFIVANVVEEIINARHIGYMTEIDDMLACIINFRDTEQAGGLTELRQMAGEAQQFLKNKFKIELTVSISNIHTSIVNLSIAYKESVDAMEYKLIMGRKEIISFNEIQNEALGEIPPDYQDADMNISMIGSRFDMKSIYLSKLFREQTGEGLRLHE